MGVDFDETKWSKPSMLMIDQVDNGLKPVRPRMSLLPLIDWAGLWISLSLNQSFMR